MPGDALITVDAAKKELHIEAPYDAEFISALKKLIPGRDRRWDPDAKIWVCHKMFLRQVQELCEEYYDSVDVEERRLQRPPPLPSPQGVVVLTGADLDNLKWQGTEQDAILAYANLIRWLTDDALHRISQIAFADRAAIHDSQTSKVIEDAYAKIILWRASRETTG